MNGLFFAVVDEDNNFIAYANSSSGQKMIYRKLAASSASFYNYESDAQNVADICEKEYPNVKFKVLRFNF